MPSHEYRFIVKGELSESTAVMFVDMTLTRTQGETMLVGPVRDQAELYAILQRLSDLGRTLVSLTRLTTPPLQ